jgi:hypothetical protein
MLIGGRLKTACVRGPPDVQVMFKRSEGGERSRRRNGIARNMLRGESCCGCGCGGLWDDCCCRDDGDRAEPALVFAFAGRMLFDGGGAGPTRVTVSRRRTTGVGEDAEDDDVMVVLVWALVELVEEVLLLLVLGVGGSAGEDDDETETETAMSMPKGVSSSFTLEEHATFLVAGGTRD